MTRRRVVGVTRRGGYGRGLHPDGPVRHAHTYAPASEFGVNVLAICGASIHPSPLREGNQVVWFDPDHPRACRRCALAVS